MTDRIYDNDDQKPGPWCIKAEIWETPSGDFVANLYGWGYITTNSLEELASEIVLAIKDAGLGQGIHKLSTENPQDQT